MPKDRDNPFSQEILNDIFKVSSKYPDRLNSRESSWLEFKEKFGFGSLSKYAKTMAAFANTQDRKGSLSYKVNPPLLEGTVNVEIDKGETKLITVSE